MCNTVSRLDFIFAYHMFFFYFDQLEEMTGTALGVNCWQSHFAMVVVLETAFAGHFITSFPEESTLTCQWLIYLTEWLAWLLRVYVKYCDYQVRLSPKGKHRFLSVHRS